MDPLRTGSSLSEAEGGKKSWSPAGEYSVDPEAKKRESARSDSQQSGGGASEGVQYHIAAVEGDSLGESYYLVDTNPQFPVGVDVPGNQFFDVDALASKLASLEVRQQGAGAPGGEISDPTVSSKGSAGFTEVALEGGGAHTVKVKVEKKGTAVSWEFMSEPKGLAFGLSFEDLEGTKNEQVCVSLCVCPCLSTYVQYNTNFAHTHTHTLQILPLRRCVSHKAALSGEYVAQKVGNYILRFDNCHSK